MINIDEEIQKFKAIPETQEIEEIIKNKDIRDVNDYIRESLNNIKQSEEDIR